MSGAGTRWGTDPNAEATAAWDGPLFDRWGEFRHLVTDGLGAHGEAALARHPPQPGERVLDIGCGFGDTTQRLAGLVGPGGAAVGVDVAPRFVEASIEEARAAGVANASFAVRDVQADPLGDGYDMAFSRMGTMFFANPVAALRNVRASLRPGGRLVMVVWRRREDNDWLYRSQVVVERIVGHMENEDEPTCGPGPFSMSGADTVSDQLLAAGFAQIALERCDIPILMGRDLDEAIRFNFAIGPAGEMLRLAGDAATPLLPQVHTELREELGAFVRGDGVRGPASTWIVSATAPG